MKTMLWIVILSLMLPQMIFASSNDLNKSSDIMEAWQQKGLINGYPDGSLKPNEPVTRAQFAKLLRTIFDYGTKKSKTFSDTVKGAWYEADVAAIVENGIMNGYPDGSFKPNKYVTRQEAAVMLHRAFRLGETETKGKLALDIVDAKNIQQYAYSAIERLYELGHIQGYADQTFKPMKALTRLEAVTLLNRLSGEIIQDRGQRAFDIIEGNAVIRSEGVILENGAIKGNAYITAGVGNGVITLKDVKIEGTLFINGGGVNSIYIEQSTIEHIVVNRVEDKVRVVIRNGSKVNQVTVEHAAIIELDESSYISLLTFLQSAAGSELKNLGTIADLINEAGIIIKANDQSELDHEGTPTRPTPTPTVPEHNDWKLVWSDEFDRSGNNLDVNGVDLDKWGYQLGTGSQYGLQGWGNNEQQYYRSENIKVEDGLLKITAKSDGFEDMPYTSGRLYTDPTFSQKYGKFEARMKLPAGEGLWPAFWMMPAGSDYGVWAASGEIDIMEARGRLLNEVGGAIHYGKSWPNNKSQADEYHFPEGEDITDYHVYSLEWEPGELRWYVDGQLYQTINNWDSWGEDQPAKYAFPAPFDKPFYMILNLAVGGNYDGGREPKEEDLPGEMLVDYVRVYELTGRPYREVTEPSVEVEEISKPYKEAIEGNYVYDTQYEQPVTSVLTGSDALDDEYWNFVALDNFGGVGSVAIEELGDTRFAKISIAQAGNETHSLQMIQQVTLGKGRWYKLSFDAKSDANRNISVKLGGGEARGWSVYSDNYTIALKEELQSFERVFQMTTDTDKLARLEFNMGLDLHPVWLGNIKLEEVEAPDPYQEDQLKEPLNNGNHIYNGSFDLGYIHRLTYWHTKVNHNAQAVFNVDAEERALTLEVSEAEYIDDVELSQKGVMLIPENEYKLSFEAITDEAKTITAALLDEDGEIYDQQTIELTPELYNYETTLYVQEAPTPYGQFVLWLGAQAGSITFDKLVLIRTTNNNIDELDFELQFPLKNGDFSNGAAGWSEHVQGRYDGWDNQTKMNIVNEELEYTIWSTGNHPWDVILSQANLQMKKGQTYIVTFDAKASLDREAELVLETDSYQRYLSERFSITPNWQSYSYELSMNSDAVLSVKLLLGKLDNAVAIGEHKVWIDDVRVEVKDARSRAFLAVNGDFDTGMDGWLTHVQGIYDGPSQASFNVDEGVLNATIVHPGANPWDIVLFQDGVSVYKGKTYIVSFDAFASTARDIEVVVENNGYVRSLNQPISLQENNQNYSFEFTMGRDEQVQLKFLLGKSNLATDNAHQVYIDHVKFELKGARAATGEGIIIEHK